MDAPITYNPLTHFTLIKIWLAMPGTYLSLHAAFVHFVTTFVFAMYTVSHGDGGAYEERSSCGVFHFNVRIYRRNIGIKV